MHHTLVHLRIVLALLGPLSGVALALPVAAQSEPAGAALDALFADLRTAPNAAAAQRIAVEIWTAWTNPDDPDQAAGMSEALQRLGVGDYSGAIARLDRLVADHPDYAEGWNQRATVYFLRRDFEQSLADIDRTLALEPRHFGALAGKALIFLELDQRELALAAITKALAIHPFLSERGLFPELAEKITNI